jgi:hypothetical protein
VEPARLICKEPVVAHWAATLRRAGLDTSSDPDGLAGWIRAADGDARLALHPTALAGGGYTCLLADVPRSVRSRVETILIASGAVLHPAGLPRDFRLLFRGDCAAARRALEALRRGGVELTLEQHGPLAGGSGEAFPAGVGSRDAAKVAIDTGPAWDPVAGRPACYVEVRPVFRSLIRAPLRRLLDDTYNLLLDHGLELVPEERSSWPAGPGS